MPGPRSLTRLPCQARPQPGIANDQRNLPPKPPAIFHCLKLLDSSRSKSLPLHAQPQLRRRLLASIRSIARSPSGLAPVCLPLSSLFPTCRFPSHAPVPLLFSLSPQSIFHPPKQAHAITQTRLLHPCDPAFCFLFYKASPPPFLFSIFSTLSYTLTPVDTYLSTTAYRHPFPSILFSTTNLSI